MRNVVIAGATGLVGRELIRQLEERKDVEFTALVRKEGRLRSLSGRVKEVVFDYENPSSFDALGKEIPCDVLLCALGTTLQTAGSPEAFRKVDFDYPVALMRRLAQLEAKPIVGVVSSIGAGRPSGLYLNTKADMERELLASGLPGVVVRPSLLLGQRKEFRMGERVAQALSKPVVFSAKLLVPRWKWLWKYIPIEASQVAHTLLLTCLDEPSTGTLRIVEGLPLHHPILAL